MGLETVSFRQKNKYMNLKKIKICGITTQPTLTACIDVGVGFVGFNLVKASSRYIDVNHALELARLMPDDIASVALVVNETDAMIEQILTTLKPAYLQLHGTETVSDIEKIKQKCDVKIIKAIPISTQADIELIKTYADYADIILCDSKPIHQNHSHLTGGHGQKFDWGLLENMPKINKPIMVAGGLNYHNLQQAQTQSSAEYFDICSGVEESKGIKSEFLIRQLQDL
jgi:phosphoribosylanthranilate isomerase